MSRTLSTESRYLLLLVALLILSTGLVAGFNRIMNPYGYFNHLQISGVNENRNHIEQLRLQKPIHILRKKPTILILGSSRSGRGFRCAFVGEDADKCYNSSIQGLTAYEMYRMLEHALAYGKIERVIWELNFYSLISKQDIRPGFLEPLFASQKNGKNFNHIKSVMNQFFHALFSKQAYDHSMRSYQFQWQSFGWFSTDVINIETDGSWGSQPTREALDDPQWLIEKKTKGWNYGMQKFSRQFKRQRRWFDNNPKLMQNNLVYIEKIIDLLHQKKIDATIVLTTGHINFSELLWQSGLDQQDNNWKRSLVSINEKVAMKNNAPAFRILDQYRVSPYTTEKNWNFLKAGKTMEWYYDPTHFNEKLGEIFVTAVNPSSQKPPTNESRDNPLYTEINQANIDSHIEKLTQQKKLYLKKTADGYTSDAL